MKIIKIFITLIIFFLTYFVLSEGRSLVLQHAEANIEEKKIFSIFSNIDTLSIITSLFGSSITNEENNEWILMISSKLQSIISSLSSFFESSMSSGTSLWAQLARVKNVENDIGFKKILTKEVEQIKNLLEIINSEKHIEISTEAVPFTTFKIQTAEITSPTTFTITRNSVTQRGKLSTKVINQFRERINDFINQIIQIFNQKQTKCFECEREGQPISSGDAFVKNIRKGL